MKIAPGAPAEKMELPVPAPGSLVGLTVRLEKQVTLTAGEADGLKSTFYSKQELSFGSAVSPIERIVMVADQVRGLDLSDAPIAHQVIQVNLAYALGPYVIVDGEWCSWDDDEELGVVVQRDPWSLLGTGETLQDAINDFRKEAREDAIAMQHDKFENLTEEAWRMRDCVMKYLPADD